MQIAGHSAGVVVIFREPYHSLPNEWIRARQSDILLIRDVLWSYDGVLLGSSKPINDGPVSRYSGGAYKCGVDETRTRDLLRDRQAF